MRSIEPSRIDKWSTRWRRTSPLDYLQRQTIATRESTRAIILARGPTCRLSACISLSPIQPYPDLILNTKNNTNGSPSYRRISAISLFTSNFLFYLRQLLKHANSSLFEFAPFYQFCREITERARVGAVRVRDANVALPSACKKADHRWRFGRCIMLGGKEKRRETFSNSFFIFLKRIK